MTAAIVAGAGLTLNCHPGRAAGRWPDRGRRPGRGGRLPQPVRDRHLQRRVDRVPGRRQDRWEAALFGGAYPTLGVRLAERPTYGGLDLLGHPEGACPPVRLLPPQVATGGAGAGHLLRR
nr:DUF3626 domain-containing protein [Micromonospora inyonensis]